MYSIHAPANPGKPALQSARLPDPVRERIRALHHSLRTQRVYPLWTRTFIRHHGLRHPRTRVGPEVQAFLNALVDPNVLRIAAGTVTSPLDALAASPGGPR